MQALWAVNFMPVANEKEYAFLRHFGIILPAAGAFLFNALSVKTSSLLLAISAMDPEIIGKVKRVASSCVAKSSSLLEKEVKHSQ